MEPGRDGRLLLLLLLLALGAAAPGEFDPYRVLGVGRSSSQADIKKAYKRLAREWYVLPLYLFRRAPGADPGVGSVARPGPRGPWWHEPPGLAARPGFLAGRESA